VSTLSEDELAATIRRYWKERGHDVDVAVRECGVGSQSGRVYVYHHARSNLLNGLPRSLVKGKDAIRSGR
jgi:hypothetical protein